MKFSKCSHRFRLLGNLFSPCNGGGQRKRTEILFRVSHILINLLSERSEIGILLFIAKLMKKMHAQVPPVNILIEIEQINFQHWFAIRMHSRAHAQAGYSLQCLL